MRFIQDNLEFTKKPGSYQGNMNVEPTSPYSIIIIAVS